MNSYTVYQPTCSVNHDLVSSALVEGWVSVLGREAGQTFLQDPSVNPLKQGSEPLQGHGAGQARGRSGGRARRAAGAGGSTDGGDVAARAGGRAAEAARRAPGRLPGGRVAHAVRIPAAAAHLQAR